MLIENEVFRTTNVPLIILKKNGSLTIFALFPSDDEVIRRERPSRRMASPSDETIKVSFAKIVKEPKKRKQL